jgi:hypothetical protein
MPFTNQTDADRAAEYPVFDFAGCAVRETYLGKREADTPFRGDPNALRPLNVTLYRVDDKLCGGVQVLNTTVLVVPIIRSVQYDGTSSRSTHLFDCFCVYISLYRFLSLLRGFLG